IDDVTLDDLVNEARSWGLTPRAAHQTVSRTIDSIHEALQHTQPTVVDLHQLIAHRLRHLTPNRPQFR
ncbi:MAG TPA: hypothetical protein PLV68_20605, partial [Ilumatobacteraceae bacterium]|nr:hypothetical protein [Ilumatobacteraceae bacterium]